MKIFWQGIILLVFFVGVFLVTTILTDSIDKLDGYYDEGISASNQVGK